MDEAAKVVTKTVPTFYFIGVTTTKSSIMQIFPLWMQALGRPEVAIQGVDLNLDDTREAYRRVTLQIKLDPLSLGALVTTHKISLLRAARDLFDDLDPAAELLGEVSSISKLANRLQGHAKDPISAGLSMDGILGEGYFGSSGGEVLVFGAGGSGSALLLHLLGKPNPADRPQRVTFVDKNRDRLDHILALKERVKSEIDVRIILSAIPQQNDHLVARLPAGSVVINATGMGKDTPGSPLTDSAVFPENGIVWEFNYRGELDFLHQAETQSRQRSLKGNLRVEDGWLYFLHGWTQVICQVLHIDLTPGQFEKLSQIASASR